MHALRFALLALILMSVSAVAGCGDDGQSSDDAGATCTRCADAGGASVDAGNATDSGTHFDSGAAGQDAGHPAVDAGAARHDAGAAVDAGFAEDAGSAEQVDAGPGCGPTEHVCECATGTYCLRIGATCISPSSPCPSGS